MNNFTIRLYLLLRFVFSISFAKLPLVPDGVYRLVNVRQGYCRSLAVNRDNGDALIMAKSQHVESQFWVVSSKASDSETEPNIVSIVSGLNLPNSVKLGGAGNGNFRIMKVENADDKNEFPSAVRIVGTGSQSKNMQKRFMATTADETSPNVAFQKDKKGGIGTEDQWLFQPIEQISFPPEYIDVIYEKYIDFWGIAIISSNNVPDEALYQAYFILQHMFSKQVWADTFNKLAQRKFKIAIVATKEDALVLPEVLLNSALRNGRYRDRYAEADGSESNGKGYILITEEHLLCYPDSDPFQGHDRFIELVVQSMINEHYFQALPGDFMGNIEKAYHKSVKLDQKWHESTLNWHEEEYLIGGTKVWFNVNFYSRPPNGTFNHVATRDDFYLYDRHLYYELKKIYPTDVNKCSCH